MNSPEASSRQPPALDPRIPRAIAGDGDALESLLVAHFDELLVFIESRMSAQLRAACEPEDILQETHKDAFLAITRLDARSDREFRGWLRTIAEHRLVDSARRLRGKVQGGDMRRMTTVATESGSWVDLLDMVDAELSSVCGQVSREEGLCELRNQLASLPEHYRQALDLRFLQELSLAETAQAMGQAEGQVRNLLYRAREMLVDRLGNSSLYRFRY